MKRVKDSETSHRDTIKMSWSKKHGPYNLFSFKYNYLSCQKAWGATAKDDQTKTLQTMHHNQDLEVIENVLPRKEKFLCEIIP